MEPHAEHLSSTRTPLLAPFTPHRPTATAIHYAPLSDHDKRNITECTENVLGENRPEESPVKQQLKETF